MLRLSGGFDGSYKLSLSYNKSPFGGIVQSGDGLTPLGGSHSLNRWTGSVISNLQPPTLAQIGRTPSAMATYTVADPLFQSDPTFVPQAIDFDLGYQSGSSAAIDALFANPTSGFNAGAVSASARQLVQTHHYLPITHSEHSMDILSASSYPDMLSENLDMAPSDLTNVDRVLCGGILSTAVQKPTRFGESNRARRRCSEEAAEEG